MTSVTVHPAPEDGAGQSHAPQMTGQAAPTYQAHHPVETPTQAVVNKATQFVKVQDVLGRIIGIKKPNAAERMRLMRVLGAELSQNPIYFGHAMLAACVREFEGELLPAATTAMQLEVLVGRLDDDGLNAVAKGLQDHFGMGGTPSEGTLDAAKN